MVTVKIANPKSETYNVPILYILHTRSHIRASISALLIGFCCRFFSGLLQNTARLFASNSLNELISLAMLSDSLATEGGRIRKLFTI